MFFCAACDDERSSIVRRDRRCIIISVRKMTMSVEHVLDTHTSKLEIRSLCSPVSNSATAFALTTLYSLFQTALRCLVQYNRLLASIRLPLGCLFLPQYWIRSACRLAVPKQQTIFDDDRRGTRKPGVPHGRQQERQHARRLQTNQ